MNELMNRKINREVIEEIENMSLDSIEKLLHTVNHTINTSNFINKPSKYERLLKLRMLLGNEASNKVYGYIKQC